MSKESSTRQWLLTIAILLCLALLSVFALRVVFFVQGIRSGTLRAEDLRFASARSVSETLAAHPLPEGIFAVETLDDPTLGSPDARVRIVEFADFGCPYSQASSFILRALAQDYGDRVRFQYRDFPLLDLHPDAERAAQAGDCAQEQGRFWDYHDKLYQNQGDLSESALVGYARALNMDTDAFRRCLTSGKYAAEVQDDVQAGLEAGVVGTPTFFINGNRIPGAIPEDVLRGLIDGVLNAK